MSVCLYGSKVSTGRRDRDRDRDRNSQRKKKDGAYLKTETEPRSGMKSSVCRRLMACLHVLLENFHPLHFVAGMGIGMSAGIMYNFPIECIRRGFRYIGIIYFFINLVVIVLNHVLFALKYMIFPYVLPYDERYTATVIDLMHEPRLAVFMGASQMSFVTMVNMLHYLKPGWSVAVFTLWWIVFAQTLSCAFFVMFFILSHATNPIGKSRFERRAPDLERQSSTERDETHEMSSVANALTVTPKTASKLHQVSPTLLLPLLTCTVTAASGGLITSSLEHPHLILAMVIVTTMLLAVALLSSLLVLAVVFARLFAYGLPRNNAAFTMFVPIGLMGQGSLAALLISKQLVRAIHKTGFALLGMSDAGQAPGSPLHLLAENLILLVGVFIALSLTAFGVLLTGWAVLSVAYWYVGFPRIGWFLAVDPRQDRVVRTDWTAAKEATIAASRRRRMRPYYVLWTPTMWAATFPLGTIAFAMRELHEVTGVTGFQIVSTIYAFAVILVTTWCMLCTAVYIVPWKRLYRSFSASSASRAGPTAE